jgi:hypothetical protein
MHVVGVRQGDLQNFFHIHPEIQGNKFVVDHSFTQPGKYSIWPGIVFKGAHVTQKMPDLVIGNPVTVTPTPNFDRIKRSGNAVITMKSAQKFYAGTDHNIGFAITDAGGFDIPLGKYLEENMHVNIISPDVKHYHHLHTNYGMVGTDSHGGAHDHSSVNSNFALVNVAQAQSSDGHTDHEHGSGSNEEEAIQFNQKDLRIMFNFPEPGLYKIFTEFVTISEPNQVRTAEFWVDVGAPKPRGSQLPKWFLGLSSIILIAAVMPFIFKYLNEDKIKV